MKKNKVSTKAKMNKIEVSSGSIESKIQCSCDYEVTKVDEKEEKNERR